MKIFIVTGKSESGDSYGPELFKKEPTQEQLKELAHKWDFFDGEGPGDFGSYVHLKVRERDVMEE